MRFSQLRVEDMAAKGGDVPDGGSMVSIGEDTSVDDSSWEVVRRPPQLLTLMAMLCCCMGALILTAGVVVGIAADDSTTTTQMTERAPQVRPRPMPPPPHPLQLPQLPPPPPLSPPPQLPSECTLTRPMLNLRFLEPPEWCTTSPARRTDPRLCEQSFITGNDGFTMRCLHTGNTCAASKTRCPPRP